MTISVDANTITLLRQGGMWYGNFAGPDAVNIRNLFGTTLVPTPFQAEVNASRVYAAIQHLNPNKTVLLEANEPEWLS
jgi:hypothetical protein